MLCVAPGPRPSISLPKTPASKKRASSRPMKRWKYITAGLFFVVARIIQIGTTRYALFGIAVESNIMHTSSASKALRPWIRGVLGDGLAIGALGDGIDQLSGEDEVGERRSGSRGTTGWPCIALPL